METFLSAISAIGSGQYLRVNINNPPPDFDIFQIRIWNHGLNYRGLIYQRGGKEILQRFPLFAQDVVSILTYLCVSRDNAALSLVDEPFMWDLNRDWYFTLNPREDAEPIVCCDSHPACQSRGQPRAACADTSTHAVLNRSQLVCPVCLTRLTPERFVPAHDLA